MFCTVLVYSAYCIIYSDENYTRSTPNMLCHFRLGAVCCSLALHLVLCRCWLGIRKSIRHVEIEWWGAGVVICLEWGAYDLHMIQLMPLPPPIISCFIIIQIGLIFLMSAYRECSLAVWCRSVTYGSVLTAVSFHRCLPFRCTLFMPIFFVIFQYFVYGMEMVTPLRRTLAFSP